MMLKTEKKTANRFYIYSEDKNPNLILQLYFRCLSSISSSPLQTSPSDSQTENLSYKDANIAALATYMQPTYHSPLQRPSVQFSSATQSCPTLWDPMNHSTPGLPVHHQLPEFTQTHVHRVSDAIQPSHPLSSPSPPAPNPSQYQSLFQWVSSSHEVAKVLEFQL